MNYTNLYDKLIEKAKIRETSNKLVGYKEIHHIIPQCLGGTDDKDNLVELTAREHYIAHLLLVKMYPHNLGLSFAVINLQKINNTNSYFYQIRSKNRLYEWVRILHQNNISKNQTGKIYYNNGERQIKIYPWEKPPVGFIRGRGFSPTQGMKFPNKNKNSVFKKSDIQIRNANKRWEKEYTKLCQSFGVSTLQEVADLIIEVKNNTSHKWVEKCIERYPQLTGNLCYSIPKRFYPDFHKKTKKENSWKGSGAGRKNIS